MLPIRDLDPCIVIRSTLQAAPRGDNLLQDRSSVPRLGRVRHGQLDVSVLAVEKARVARTEVHGCERGRSGPRSHRVARRLRDPSEYVGAHVPAAQGVQVPVSGYGRDGRVVVVVCRVDGAAE